MKVKATYKSIPFNPDIPKIGYSKTVDVPDDMDMKRLEMFAIEDTMEGYKFDTLKKIKEQPNDITI